MKKVGFVGWRGMVGSVLLDRMVIKSDFRQIDPYFFSTSQVGQQAPDFNQKQITLLDASSIDELKKMDIILTCQGGSYTQKIYPLLKKNRWDGHWIDAASTLRMEKNALIVLDPLNNKAIDEAFLSGIKTWVGGNCTVSLMLLAIQGLIEHNAVEWVSSMTYQAASGAGAKNMRELLIQMGEIHSSVTEKIENLNHDVLDLDKTSQDKINSKEFTTEQFGFPLAGSLIPWIDEDLDNGTSKEEWKGQIETNKILSPTFNSIKVDGLCVRIGTMRSHSQALTIKLKKNINLEKVENLLTNGNNWVKFVANNKTDSANYLTPAAVSGKLDIAIGRVRMLDLEDNVISAFTVGDQLLWGAAEPLRRMLNIIIKKESKLCK
jgi:aspartate-semialdehyde dehydrogenase